jgi:predicted GIY-YIG superfamily endonuclease
MKFGFLYIISNPAHIGWVKVGVTEDINSRLRTYQTSDPQRAYKVEYYISHPDAYTAEKKVKELMKPFAKRIVNEWYEIDLSMAIPRLDETLEDLPVKIS